MIQSGALVQYATLWWYLSSPDSATASGESQRSSRAATRSLRPSGARPGTTTAHTMNMNRVLTSSHIFKFFVRPLSAEAGGRMAVPTPKSCAICFENIENGSQHQLPCSHVYHARCTQEWAVTLTRRNCQPSCPMCRMNFSGTNAQQE